MRCEASSPTSIKHKALEIATSSVVKTEASAGNENEWVATLATNAQPHRYSHNGRSEVAGIGQDGRNLS